MNIQEIISNLQCMIDLMKLDPVTGETIDKSCMNELNRTHCTALEEAIKELQKNSWISVDDRLPENREKVLILAGNIHIGKEISIATFFHGISNAEREEMIKNGDKRSEYFYPEDEWGNNLKPYYWKGLYQMNWFGQEVLFWMPLPEPPKTD